MKGLDKWQIAISNLSFIEGVSLKSLQDQELFLMKNLQILPYPVVKLGLNFHLMSR